MKTVLATFIVLLFCLPTITQADVINVRSQEAATVIMKGKILVSQVTEHNAITYSVAYKGRLYWCTHQIDYVECWANE